MNIELINNLLTDLYVEYKSCLRKHMPEEATKLFAQIKYYEEKREALETPSTITVKINEV